jgi:hypothetical protein
MGSAMQAEIKTLIESVVRKQFAKGQIDSVMVREDVDHEGDPIFWVTIVFDDTRPLDPRVTVSIGWRIRHKLLDRDETAFPVLRFVSRSDAAELTPAAV